MMVHRKSSSDQLLGLKAAFRRLASLCGGPESAQHITRPKAAALSRYGGIADEAFAGIDVVLDLEIDAGSPVVTAQLAAAQGYRLVLDEAAAGKGTIAVGDMADLLSHTTGVANHVAAALADGTVDGAEANRIIDAAEDAIKHLRHLQSRAKAASSHGHGGEVADER